MKIGIFGGTFSPPHTAHIALAKSAVTQLSLDKLFVLPCGIPPHKQTEVSAEHRLAMSRIAFGNLEKTEVDDFELNSLGNSYSYLTLEHYATAYPQGEFYFLIGGDSLRDFATWRNPARICQLATLAVLCRKGIDSSLAEQKVIEQYNAKIVHVDAAQSDVSSSVIRLDCQFGFKNDCLPKPIADYIVANKLYTQYGDLIAKLKQNIDAERFKHTYYVIKRGLQLREDIPWEKAFLACLLHDCAKRKTPDDWQNYGFTNPNGLHAKLVHAELGALVAKQDYGITDKEILDAIFYHTTSRANMTKLDKLVYCADKLAENRPFPVNHLFASTLDETFILVLSEVKETHATRTDWTKTQLEAFEYYLGGNL